MGIDKVLSCAVLFAVLLLPPARSSTAGTHGSRASRSIQSPFGIFEGELEDLKYLPDLGVQVVAGSWVPFLGLMYSLGPDPWPLYTTRYNAHLQAGVDVMPIIPLTSEEFYGMTFQAYYDAVQVLVTHFDQSEYFLLTLEADGMGMGDAATRDNAERYALFIRLTYKAIKAANPFKKLATAGTSGTPCAYDEQLEPCVFPPDISNANYFRRVFREIGYLEAIEKDPSLYDWNENKYGLSIDDFALIFEPDGYNDYMEVHHFSAFVFHAIEYRASARLHEVIREVLDREGFSGVELWNTQSGTHSGTPTDLPNARQTEGEQATTVVKHHVVAWAYGVKKVFWNGVYEGAYPASGGGLGDPLDPDAFFALVPFVYDGEGQEGAGNGGVKKLAYYTYKKMVETLNGADANNVVTLIDGADNVYAYRFNVAGKWQYIAWWDYFNDPTYTPGDTKNLVLSGLIGTTVSATDLVPDYADGLDLINSGASYATAFTVTDYPSAASVVTLTLAEDPVIIETDGLPGDFDGNGSVDLADLDVFVAVLIGLDADPVRVATADMNGDGGADGGDIQAFADRMLGP